MRQQYDNSEVGPGKPQTRSAVNLRIDPEERTRFGDELGVPGKWGAITKSGCVLLREDEVDLVHVFLVPSS